MFGRFHLRAAASALLARGALLTRRAAMPSPRFASSSSASAHARAQEARQARARAQSAKNQSFAIYMFSVAIGVAGLSYAAVPLYKVFCQATGYGGTTMRQDDESRRRMTPVEGGRVLDIRFDGGTSGTMPWTFTPQQQMVRIVPGETALAFYKARNPSDEDIIGVATYNVLPMKAGVYFNKIQCFCFEEQRLKAKEEVDMPVFFYVDPKFLEDPQMDNVHSITLSYTFFRSANQDKVVDA